METNDADALIVGCGLLPTRDIVERLVRDARLVVCLDGAANGFAEKFQREPDIIVGDGDSLDTETRLRYSDRLYLEPEDQEYNDLTKAVRLLSGRELHNLKAIGLTGGREEHTLGNVSLLGWHMERGNRIVAYTPHGVFLPCRNRVKLSVEVGQQISVFRFSARGLRAEGLLFPLYDFDYAWQGTVNESTAENVVLEGEGVFLVYISSVVKKH